MIRALAVAFAIWLSQSDYRVTRVVDGDTLVISTIGTVRLIGVNTPETVDPRKPVQAFGREASAFLRELVTGKSVRVEYDVNLTDRYGRTLAYVYLLDGRFVNLEIVRAGYGNAYTEFPFRMMDEFRAVEREARTASRGLWSTSAPRVEDTRLVYIGSTGTKYHRQDCRTLRATKTAIRLDETPGHYGPCEVCNPIRLK